MSSIAPDAPEYDEFVRALHDLKLKPTILTAAEADALENELNIYEPVTVDELLARSGLEAQKHRPQASRAGTNSRRPAWPATRATNECAAYRSAPGNGRPIKLPHARP